MLSERQIEEGQIYRVIGRKSWYSYIVDITEDKIIFFEASDEPSKLALNICSLSEFLRNNQLLPGSRPARRSKASELRKTLLGLEHLAVEREEEVHSFFGRLHSFFDKHHSSLHRLVCPMQDVHFLLHAILNGGNSIDHFVSGLIFCNQGNLNEAQAAFTQAAREEPDYPLPYVYLGLVAEHMEAPTSARSYYRKAQKLISAKDDILRSTILVALGSSLISEGRQCYLDVSYERALDNLQEAKDIYLKQMPIEFTADLLIIYSLMVICEYRRSRDMESVAGIYNEGIQALNTMQDEGLLEDDAAFLSNVGTIHSHYALCLTESAREEEAFEVSTLAEKWYQRAIAVDPEHHPTYFNLGKLLYHQFPEDRMEEALGYLDRALRIATKREEIPPHYYDEFVRACIEAGEYHSAQILIQIAEKGLNEQISQAIAQGDRLLRRAQTPSEANVRNALLSEAEERYRRALTLSGDKSAKAHYRLSKVYEQTNHPGLLAVKQRAADLNPRVSEGIFQEIAALQIKEGQFLTAVITYEKAMGKLPDQCAFYRQKQEEVLQDHLQQFVSPEGRYSHHWRCFRECCVPAFELLKSAEYQYSILKSQSAENYRAPLIDMVLALEALFTQSVILFLQNAFQQRGRQLPVPIKIHLGIGTTDWRSVTLPESFLFSDIARFAQLAIQEQDIKQCFDSPAQKEAASELFVVFSEPFPATMYSHNLVDIRNDLMHITNPNALFEVSRELMMEIRRRVFLIEEEGQRFSPSKRNLVNCILDFAPFTP